MQLEEDGFREHFGASQEKLKSSSSGAVDGEESEGGDGNALLNLPPVITVFSAPEYCNTNHNMVRCSWTLMNQCGIACGR